MRLKYKFFYILFIIACGGLLYRAIYAEEIIEFNGLIQPDFMTIAETEIVTDMKGENLYITKKYFSEDNFLRIEMSAIKENKYNFYLYNKENSFIWQISGTSKIGYLKKPDIDKIAGYKNLIKKTNEEKIKELTGSRLINTDEIEMEVLSIKKEYYSGIPAYCFKVSIKDIFNGIKREQIIWISTDRRILKEIEYMFDNSLNSEKPSNIITKYYDYDVKFQGSISIPEKDIDYKIK
ncbi:MAG TPA: hypothetical protein PKY81_16680 [bacterium]|nr:hypothetical protein [bacterium]